MSHHSVQVHQLTSPMDEAYFNVEDQDSGRIGIWGGFDQRYPTYLILDQHIFRLIRFDSQVFYNEWLEEHKDDGLIIISVSSLRG